MKFVILSQNERLYSTRRLKEAALEAGHDVDVRNYVETHMLIEPGDNKIFLGKEDISDVDAIIPRIGAQKTFFGGAAVRQFEMNNVFSLNSSIAIVRARDKLRSLQILAKHNVQIPKTAFASTPKNVDAILNSLGGAPVVLKILEGTQGIGVVLAETRKAAKSVIEAFYGLKVNFLVQEFIAEAKSADIRTIVLDGKVIAAMKRQGLESDFRSNIHRGGEGQIIKLSKEEKKAAVDAAKAMGLLFAGVDILQSDRGPLVLEVNSSPGLEGIEKTTGLDVAGIVIKYLEKNAHKGKVDKIGV